MRPSLWADFLFTELTAPGWTELQMFPCHSADQWSPEEREQFLKLLKVLLPSLSPTASVAPQTTSVWGRTEPNAAMS